VIELDRALDAEAERAEERRTARERR
jgi:hypothetical protein